LGWDDKRQSIRPENIVFYFKFCGQQKYSNLTAGAQKLEFKIPKDADEENSWYFDFNWKNEYAKTNSRN
jgi:hypothetical protein